MRPRQFWFMALLASGLFLFLLSRIFAFRFGWPDRFLLYSLPLAVILLFPIAWRAAGQLPALWGRGWRGLGLVAWGAVFMVSPLGLAGPGRNVLDLKPMQEVWQAVRALPEGSLLAGWPSDMDNLPLMSQKEPFIDYEHAYPLYRGYYAKVAERLTDNLRLVFATNTITVSDVARRYGLTHVLLRRNTLTHDGRTPVIFAPFNDMASEMRRGSPPERFVFNSVPTEAVPYSGTSYFVVDLGKWPATGRNTQKAGN